MPRWKFSRCTDLFGVGNRHDVALYDNEPGSTEPPLTHRLTATTQKARRLLKQMMPVANSVMAGGGIAHLIYKEHLSDLNTDGMQQASREGKQAEQKEKGLHGF